MKAELDFSYIRLKINASGSWCNVMRFHIDRFESVKEACKVLAIAAEGRMKFKLADDEGGTLEILESGHSPEWKKATR